MDDLVPGARDTPEHRAKFAFVGLGIVLVECLRHAVERFEDCFGGHPVAPCGPQEGSGGKRGRLGVVWRRGTAGPASGARGGLPRAAVGPSVVIAGRLSPGLWAELPPDGRVHAGVG
jgi:hypothetical protein